MSQVARASNRWTSSTKPYDGATNSPAASELALRAAVGIVSAQAASRTVQRHPWLSVLFASGIGYLFGTGFMSDAERPNVRKRSPKEDDSR